MLNITITESSKKRQHTTPCTDFNPNHVACLFSFSFSSSFLHSQHLDWFQSLTPQEMSHRVHSLSQRCHSFVSFSLHLKSQRHSRLLKLQFHLQHCWHSCVSSSYASFLTQHLRIIQQ